MFSTISFICMQSFMKIDSPLQEVWPFLCLLIIQTNCYLYNYELCNHKPCELIISSTIYYRIIYTILQQLSQQNAGLPCELPRLSRASSLSTMEENTLKLGNIINARLEIVTIAEKKPEIICSDYQLSTCFKLACIREK